MLRQRKWIASFSAFGHRQTERLRLEQYKKRAGWRPVDPSYQSAMIRASLAVLLLLAFGAGRGDRVRNESVREPRSAFLSGFFHHELRHPLASFPGNT